MLGDGVRLVGVVTSGARASSVPIRVSREYIGFVRDEMLALVEDVDEDRLYLGVIKGSVKRDIAIDGSSLPTNFDAERSLGYSAPIMMGFVEIIGEIVGGSLELSFSIPRPGSRVYVVASHDVISKLLRLPTGLHVGFHKFSGIEVHVDPVALDYHVAVLGATGTGKSRLVKALVEEVLAKTSYGILIFDHTGVDYSDPTRWGFTPRVVDGSRLVLTPDVIAEMVADKMRIREHHADYVFGALVTYIAESLGSKSFKDVDLERVVESYLEACRRGSFKWSFEGFLQALDAYLGRSNAWDSTRLKLKLLASIRVGRRFFENYLNRRDIVIGDVVESLLSGEHRLVVVDLSGEVEYDAKKFIVYQFLREIWDRILEARSRAELVAVIDEAHNYACSRGCEPSMEMIARTAREGRKWGFGLILASQRVIDLAPEVRGNVNTVFFSRVQSAGDYEELKRWIEGLQFIEYTLPMLARREFYLAGLGNPLRKPILVRVRDVA